MGLLRSFLGVMKVTFHMTIEEWNTMDKKFFRLAVGAISFLAMGVFYYFFLRNLAPF